MEVQIVGDEYGNAVALSGRDCSTQRRFQKIFEEGPPIIAPPEIFRQMERSAQRLTQSIGYIGKHRMTMSLFVYMIQLCGCV